MSLLSRIAEGVGGYLVEQGKLQDEMNLEKVKDDILLQRELALEQVKGAIQQQQDVTQHADKLSEIDETGNQSRTTAVTEGAVGAQRDALKGSQDLSNQEVIKGIEAANARSLAILNHNATLTEDQQRSALSTAHDLAVAGVTVDHWAVDKDGQMVAFNKKGDILRYSTGNEKFPQPQSAADAFAQAIGLNGGSSAPTPAPAPAPAPTPAPAFASPAQTPTGGNDAQRAQALARLGNLYAQAAQNPDQVRQQYPGMFDASGNLLPRDQLIQQVNQAYGN